MNLRALTGSLILVLAVAPVAYAEQTVMAAWTRHEVELAYMGFTTLYSCDGLADKTRTLLKHIGARPDFKVTPRGCAGLQRVSEFPRVKMEFYTATIPGRGQKDAGEPVPAVWQKVTIVKRSPKNLELGDCELVEQFRDKVLPLFTTRNVLDETTCIPHQLAGSDIKLQFEVLRGLPPVDAARVPAKQ
jgi:hypothetical protein